MLINGPGPNSGRATAPRVCRSGAARNRPGVALLYKMVGMHKVHCAYPSPALSPFVRTYAERQLESLTSIWTPVPAYLDQLIDFEFRDPITVLTNDGRLGVHSCIVSGAQTEGRAQVLLGGKIHSFAIFFKPSGLSRCSGSAGNGESVPH